MKRIRRSMGTLVLCALATGGCGSSYTNLNQSELTASSYSRTVARLMTPGMERNPQMVADALANAEELYVRKLKLLQDRRSKVRARQRGLQFATYGVLGATSLGVSGLAIGGAARGDDTTSTLIGAGAASLVGLGLGSVLQIVSLMQEDTALVDAKINSLNRAHEEMSTRMRELGTRSPADPAEATRLQYQMGEAIERFLKAAGSINVKG